MSSPGSARLRAATSAGVRQHLERRRTALLGGGDGVVGRVHQLGEFVEPLTVRTRDAHQLGDQAGRQTAGDVVDEVALAAFDHVVDDLAGEFPDPVAEQLGALRGEPPADEELEPVVLRWVHHQHHLALDHQPHLVGLGEHHPLRR